MDAMYCSDTLSFLPMPNTISDVKITHDVEPTPRADNNPLLAAHEHDMEEARKRMEVKSVSPTVAAAEAAVEEARAVMGTQPQPKPLLPLDADAPAETIAPYAEYQKDSITTSVNDYAIRVKEYQDEHGRRFYEFDNGRSKPLLACIFTTTAGQLISLNGVVMPLVSFQSIVYARTAPAKVGKEAKRTASRTGGDLRAAIPVGDEKVLCTLTDGQSLSIPNTTVQYIMMALQRLAPPAHHIETDDEEHVGPLRRLWRWLY
jgi:hypothetical protein